MESLNQDVLIEILSHLPLKDKIQSSNVCKLWLESNKYIYQNQLVKINFDKLQNPKFVDWIDKRNIGISLDIRILDNFTKLCIPKHLYSKIVEFTNFFSEYSILDVPEYIFEFENLMKLCINWNRIEVISDKISNLTSLETCYLSFNNLKTLPDSFGKLKNLKSLYLQGNKFDVIPECIFDLENLKELSLENNSISFIQTDIYKLKKLKYLNLSENKFEIYPDVVNNVESLMYLYLSCNNIKIIPDSVTRLENLVILNVDDNRIKRLPHGVTQMKKISVHYQSQRW
jgi:Leucine-rich repeat (LRR) protein